MSPEAINSLEFSEKSDVWSFGMLILEMLTYQDPYAGLTLLQTADAVRAGTVPSIPDSTPRYLKDVLMGCWQFNAAQRPTFAQIAAQLSTPTQ
jgi:serine/threonine protein kinase